MTPNGFNDHLAERVAELKRELQRVRTELSRQRRRAELWRHRALLKGKP